ncbi:MAG: Rieske (2Fe-2S) protein [Terriglobia bacterium]
MTPPSTPSTPSAPHRGAPLANGQLINRFGVECPGHKWTFDLRTGKPDHEGGHEVATYEVKVEGDDIVIGWIKKT